MDRGADIHMKNKVSIKIFKHMAVHKKFHDGLMGCHNITLQRYYT
jgi:hypothetical protein